MSFCYAYGSYGGCAECGSPDAVVIAASTAPLATGTWRATNTDAFIVLYGAGLVDLSCPSSLLCAAGYDVDPAENDLHGAVGSVVNPASAPRWSIAEYPTSFDPHVACPSNSLCLAWGAGNPTLVSTEPTGQGGGYGPWALTGPSEDALGCTQSMCLGVPSAAPGDLVVGTLAPSTDQGWVASESNGQALAAGEAPELGGARVNAPVVGIASSPSGRGYCMVGADGGVFAFGDARYDGSLPGLGVHVNDIVGIAATRDGRGYWLVGSDGGIFAFGDAVYRGSLPALHVTVRNVVGVGSSPGDGYWLVGADGGVFAFGSPYHGSLPGLHHVVNDVVGMAPSVTGSGYLLVGRDGGVFSFGSGNDYVGSIPGLGFAVDDIVGIALTPDQHGYWLARVDDEVFPFGDADLLPEPPASPPAPFTGITST